LLVVAVVILVSKSEHRPVTKRLVLFTPQVGMLIPGNGKSQLGIGDFRYLFVSHPWVGD